MLAELRNSYAPAEDERVNLSTLTPTEAGALMADEALKILADHLTKRAAAQ
jgi:hypothetical protein